MIEPLQPAREHAGWPAPMPPSLPVVQPTAGWYHRLVRLYGPAVALCFLAAAAPLLFGLGPLYTYVDLTNGAQPFFGMMTALSGIGLGGAAALFALIAQYVPPAQRLAWRMIAVSCIWLALDEIMMWHEALNDRLAALGVPRFLGVADQDMYIFLFYGVVLAAIGWRVLPTVFAHRAALLPLGVGAVCFAISMAADFPRWEDLSVIQRGILGPLEEGSKLIGVWSIVLYAAVLLDSIVGVRAPRPG